MARASDAPAIRPPATLIALSLVLVASCGARTGPLDLEPAPCVLDVDCADGLACNGVEICAEGRCGAGLPVPCDDGDLCTIDSCIEGEDGGAMRCVSDDVRVDEDGDTFFAIAIEYAGCGDDCDDRDALVHPAAAERCNGGDDDCDLRIDEGASYDPTQDEARLTFDDAPSSRGALSFSETSATYGATYWDYGDGSADVYFLELTETGVVVSGPKLLTPEPGDAFGATIAWTGTAYAIAWQDRRDGDYEIYFNRLTPDGEKLAPDVRLTTAPSWSISPELVFTGGEHAIVWQDGRDELEAPDNYEIYLTFVDVDGFEIGDDIRLTSDPHPSERPAVALRDLELGIAYVDGRTDTPAVYVLVTDLLGRVVQPPTLVSRAVGRAIEPDIAAMEGGFVVTWEEDNGAGDVDVYAALVERPSGVVRPPKPVAATGAFERAPTASSNGDSLIVAFMSDGRGDFGLEATVLDADLEAQGSPLILADHPGDAAYPFLARGQSTLGVLYDAQDERGWEVYFTRLLCIPPRDTRP